MSRPVARPMPWPREDPKFILWFWWDVIDGVTQLVGFEMRSVSALWTDAVMRTRAEVEQTFMEHYGIEPRPLRTVDLRAVSLTSEADHSRRQSVQDLIDLVSSMSDEEIAAKTEAWRETLKHEGEVLATGRELQVERKSKKGVLDEAHFEEVAQVYSIAAQAGQPATRAVQEHFTERWGQPITRNQAAKWVSRARNEHGLLKPTEPRQQGGHLTADDLKDQS